MSGIELYKIVDGNFPDARVLFMSGYSAEMYVSEPSGITDSSFLAKPFDLGTLLERAGRGLEE